MISIDEYRARIQAAFQPHRAVQLLVRRISLSPALAALCVAMRAGVTGGESLARDVVEGVRRH